MPASRRTTHPLTNSRLVVIPTKCYKRASSPLTPCMVNPDPTVSRPPLRQPVCPFHRCPDLPANRTHSEAIPCATSRFNQAQLFRITTDPPSFRFRDSREPYPCQTHAHHSYTLASHHTAAHKAPKHASGPASMQPLNKCWHLCCLREPHCAHINHACALIELPSCACLDRLDRLGCCNPDPLSC